jgi:NADH dehydrogenase FAD-containing subunit
MLSDSVDLLLQDHLRVAGTDGTIFALGDCTSSQYAPTAQVASQQGAYVARMFKQLAKRDALLEQIVAGQKEGASTESLEKQVTKIENLRPFHYSHQGSLAYIGSEKAIADLEFFHHKVRLLFGHDDRVLTNPIVFLRWRCDIPVLAERLHEHTFLVAESRFGLYRLVEGETVRTVCDYLLHSRTRLTRFQ